MSAPRLAAAEPMPSNPGSQHLRRQSRAGSISSSSVVTVRPSRSASLSLREGEPGASAEHPHTASNHIHASSSSSSSSTRPRRRSSAAHHDHTNVNGNLARKLSISGSTTTGPLAALNGNINAPPPQLPALPPMLLPAVAYDPNSPSSASTANSPSTAGLFTPSVFATAQPTDYFNSKPRTPLTAQRPPSRTRVDRVLGRSPLGSPAILGVGEPDARQNPGAGATRAPSAGRPPAASSREPVQTRAPSAGHRRSTSRDHQRSESRDTFGGSESRGHYRSTSRDHNRSESTSSRFDDSHHDTPPRTRERREKDKKTMLSRALQKANTAVLLDNAQNFEGAMEAYEDACKLLQQVMIRSSQDEDRRKLDAIVSSLSRSQLFWAWLCILTPPARNIHQSHRGAPSTRPWIYKQYRKIAPRAADER